MKTKAFNPSRKRAQELSLKIILIFLFTSNLFCLDAQTYTFTTAGANGSMGPTQPMVVASYSNTNLNNSVTVQGLGIQTFTIQMPGIYRIHCYGAQGGYNGGFGAYSVGDFTFTSGAVLKIAVGQAGSYAVNAQNRGSGGGGGGSFVATLADVPLVVAGGGGGYGDGYAFTVTNTPQCCIPEMNASLTTSANPCPGGTNNGVNGNGGGCGVLSGGAGAGFYTSGSGCASAIPAREFTITSGPVGGFPTVAGAGSGGYGGGGGGYNSSNGNRGGGGGGYSGGGPGDAPSTGNTTLSVGGGGATYNSGVNVTNSLSAFTGDGLVIIEHVCLLDIVATGLSSFGNQICAGSVVTLSTFANGAPNWSNGSNNTYTTAVTPTATTIYTVTGSTIFSCIGTGTIQINVSPGLPQLSVSPSSASICLGGSLNLSVSGALTYSWLVQGNVTTTNCIVSPSASTIYYVNGANPCGISTSSINITVNPLPVTALFTSPTVCVNNTIALSINAGGGNYVIQPVGISGTQTNVVLTPTATTVYSITALNGVCQGSTTVNLTAYPLPQINLSAGTLTICPGKSTTLSATGGLSYSWNIAGLIGNLVTVSPTVNTSYLVAGTNVFGCENFAFQQLYANPSPTLGLAQTANLICAGKSATLSVSGTQSYTWLPTNSTNSTIIVSPQVTSIYTCIGMSTLNCSDTKTLMLSVFNPSVSVSYPSGICAGSVATIQASAAQSYSWNGVIGAATSIVAPIVNSIYFLSVVSTSLSQTCDYSVAITISVNPVPQIYLVNLTPNRCAGETFSLAVSGATSYSFNGLPCGNQISFSTITNTIVILRGEDDNGCAAQISKALYVNQCTGIYSETLENKFMIYPNPNNGTFKITNYSNEDLLLKDIQGREIEFINSGRHGAFEISGLAPGLYFLYETSNPTKLLNKIAVYSE